MFDLNLIDTYFPLPQMRPGQRECIENILTAFNDGKKFVILEAPVGSGKSVIGMTIAKFFENSYYLTIQKILQDQLANDFEDHETKVLKGRNAYPCNYWSIFEEKHKNNPQKQKEATERKKNPKILATVTNQHLNASEGVCLTEENKSKDPLCFPNGLTNLSSSTCPYWKALGEAIDSKTCIMNFSSFLYQTAVSNRFGPRGLMIIDEAHSSESQLMDFISLTISDKQWIREGIKIPELETAEQYAEYFHQIQLPEKIEEIVKISNYQGDYKKAEEWKKALLQYKVFSESVSSGDWIAKWESKGPYSKVTLKPIFVDKHAGRYLFSYGDKVLLMSATILSADVIYDSLGIDPADAYAYRMKNRFPVENRPIYFKPSGSMSYKNKQTTMPKMIADVELIADHHKEHRGIIHTHNFEIAKNIIEKASKKLKPRIFYQEDFLNKDELLEKHAKSPNGIIVAPAMHEGLNLIDDLSRFQILCKIPYPAFQDNDQLKIRMQLSDEYYTWLTALKTVQSVGRSVRSETDWADTYILDSDFELFKKKAHKMLPKWFLEAIQ